MVKIYGYKRGTTEGDEKAWLARFEAVWGAGGRGGGGGGGGGLRTEESKV
jgi:hypothetical protein